MSGALLIAIMVILIGIAGTILPGLPGVFLVFAAIVGYGWYEGFVNITPRYIVVLSCLTVLSLMLSYFSAIWGAKYFGSSKYGVWGAGIGIVLGLILFPPLGIFIGPLIGAFIGEYWISKDMEISIKAAIASLIGIFSGTVFNFILALGIFISFLIVVL